MDTKMEKLRKTATILANCYTMVDNPEVDDLMMKVSPYKALSTGIAIGIAAVDSDWDADATVERLVGSLMRCGIDRLTGIDGEEAADEADRG